MIDLISGVSQAIDIARQLKKSADAIKDSEAKLLIADLMSQLADVKIRCSELVDENSDLKKKILTIATQKEAGVTLAGDVYISGNDGPFCTTCWDSQSKRIRLKEEIKDFQDITGHKYICPICQSRHKGESG